MICQNNVCKVFFSRFSRLEYYAYFRSNLYHFWVCLHLARA